MTNFDLHMQYLTPDDLSYFEKLVDAIDDDNAGKSKFLARVLARRLSKARQNENKTSVRGGTFIGQKLQSAIAHPEEKHFVVWHRPRLLQPMTLEQAREEAKIAIKTYGSRVLIMRAVEIAEPVKPTPPPVEFRPFTNPEPGK